MTEYRDVPPLDEARRQLMRHFGVGVQAWLEELPDRLLALREPGAVTLTASSQKAAFRWSSAAGPRLVNGRLKISPRLRPRGQGDSGPRPLCKSLSLLRRGILIEHNLA